MAAAVSSYAAQLHFIVPSAQGATAVHLGVVATLAAVRSYEFVFDGLAIRKNDLQDFLHLADASLQRRLFTLEKAGLVVRGKRGRWSTLSTTELGRKALSELAGRAV